MEGSGRIFPAVRARGLAAWTFVPTPRRLWRIFAAGCFALVPFLFLQYVGEEAVTVIVTQEMWASGDFVRTTMYGHNYGRPGLFSWAMLPPTLLAGWDHVLLAARAVTVAATIAAGLTLAWLVRRIFKDDLLAAFSAATYLSGDVLIYRGWLAYADPLYACLIFVAMACLWVATAERRLGLLAAGAVALGAAFLTKTVTGYVFYGTLGLVLLWRHDNRGFLLRPLPVAVHVAALAFPFAWDALVAGHAVLGPLLLQFALPFESPVASDPLGHLARVLWYPVRTAWYLMPVSAVAIVCLARRSVPPGRLVARPLDVAAWTVLLGMLPYWLAPDGGTRYLMPLYPLFALLMASVVLAAGRAAADIAVKALVATVALAFGVGLVGFPLYESRVRGDYAAAARAVVARVGDAPLYALDVSSLGASIVANVNALRRPRLPLARPPADWADGFVLAMEPDPALGRTAATVRVGSRTRYLLCRGPACGPHG